MDDFSKDDLRVMGDFARKLVADSQDATGNAIRTFGRIVEDLNVLHLGTISAYSNLLGLSMVAAVQTGNEFEAKENLSPNTDLEKWLVTVVLRDFRRINKISVNSDKGKAGE